ncbi:MAG: superoxide dismutase [Candidatus Daviesbacteria bacterium]|nr:superoxide dismutase [Candidatus Daviesbacteria bacterium]
MFTLPELPFSYNSLEPSIDETTMKVHHDKHHATYVTNLNQALEGHEDLLNMEIGELISNLSQVPVEIRTKVRNNGGGHYNHSLFWTLLSPKGGEPSPSLLEKINQSFESLSSFKEQFKKAALGRFGSGWTWVIVNPDGTLGIVDTPNQDSPVMEDLPAGPLRRSYSKASRQGKQVILGLDVWEHSYYLKYQNRRAEYIDAFWNIVNWDTVEKLLKS